MTEGVQNGRGERSRLRVGVIGAPRMVAEAVATVLVAHGISVTFLTPENAPSVHSGLVDVIVVAAKTPATARAFVGLLPAPSRRLPLVLVAGRDHPSWSTEVARIGVCDWLSPEEGASGLLAALAGRPTGCPPRDRGAIRGADIALERLSVREREVLFALSRGASIIEIGAALRISVHTVRTHLSNAMVKLGVGSRLEAVSMALGARSWQPHEWGRVS